MKFSNKEVMDAILNNDTTRAAEMLEGFGLTKDGSHLKFTFVDRALVLTMLGFASVMSYHDKLNSDLAKELIERTAMTVNIFPFARLVIATAGIETDDFNIIPEEIRIALLKDNYTDKVTHAIEKLDDDAFAALLVLLTTEFEQVDAKINLPIIRRIYAKKTIPENLILAYMGLCARQTVEEIEHLPIAAVMIGLRPN